MAHSLEVRVPCWTMCFVEWAAALPPALRLKGREGKYVLKKAIEPHAAARRAVPPEDGIRGAARHWFRGPLRDARARARRWGRLARDRLFRADNACGASSTSTSSGARDHSAAIWALLMFDAFLRNVLRADTSDAPAAYAA